MPKVNVYLPDGLADRVREAKLPISRICQIALTQALESASGPTGATSPTATAVPGPTEPTDLTPPPNHHVALILRQARSAAADRGAAEVDTADVLNALLDEGESVALTTVERLGFPRDDIRRALARAAAAHRADAVAPAAGPPRLSAGTRTALATGAAQATEHGSDVTTASHLLLGLIRDAGPAGEAMRRSGVADTVTPAVLSALYFGVSFGRIRLERDTEEAWLRTALTEITTRLGRIERGLPH
ncbi:Clp protease N-terminal domain-containing protein [Streptomyces sp. DSM 44915]|uniref:Clp protease N-terminal domain-containing protein n=1 Tax=Streptomyces chisholmiae TaxID=3075540 RepID=A0ABU2JNY8_9ACTN|nr:Clp protease N-terminal domain-containing protein [Streptomyces sp. DSM 44915]MDT0266711.1 Clp protease N-terminal domain-containing protein [Streptomyces sp. DSM 44915]